MHLNWRLVAIHAAIIFALTIIGGFFTGMLARLGAAAAPMAWLAVSNLVFASAGFAYSSYKMRDQRWAHLAAVALILWIVSLVNPILGFSTLTEWLISLIAILVFMLIGGGAGILIEKFVRTK